MIGLSNGGKSRQMIDRELNSEIAISQATFRACLCGAGEGDDSKLAQARSEVYGFLAWFFNRRPDMKTVEVLVNSRLALVALAEELGSPHAKDLDVAIQDICSMPSERAKQVLGVDRTYLFRGVDINHGAYLGCESRYRGSSTLRAVTDAYAVIGLRPDSCPSYSLDSLGTELSFMSALAKREARALEDKDSIAAQRFAQGQRTFLTEHLSLWLEPLLKDVTTATQHAFWPALVELILMFVNTDTASTSEACLREQLRENPIGRIR